MTDYDSNTQESTEPKYLDGEWLREKYIEEGKTQYELADVCGVKQATISRWLQKHGIGTRCRSRAQNPNAKIELLRDEEWLREKYHGETLSVHEIGELCNVKGTTAAKWLSRQGIEVRTGSEKQARHADSLKFTNPEWLREQYIAESRGARSIAEECGVSQASILRHLKKCRIKVRPRVRFGEDHPNWTGEHPYQLEDWSSARKKAFEEWGGWCQSCGIGRDKHRERYATDLEVHHIQKVTTFGNPKDANSVDNLAPMCKKCHKMWEGIPLRPTII